MPLSPIMADSGITAYQLRFRRGKKALNVAREIHALGGRQNLHAGLHAGSTRRRLASRGISPPCGT